MISHDPTHAPSTAATRPTEISRGLFERAYARCMDLGGGLEKHLLGVLRQTLDTPGAMNRALLAGSLMDAWGAPAERCTQVATAIEYWHAASLLLDDLPCMDNASERRGESCAHTRFGEAPAILGALGLINKAYSLAWSAMSGCGATSRTLAAELIEECLGVQGILNGQALDLAFQESDRTAREVLRIADGKTGTLLRLTLQWPALMAGVTDPVRQEALHQLAIAWGRVYQIMDDAKDLHMSARESGKTAGRDLLNGRPNLVVALGGALACETLQVELRRAESAIATLMREARPAAILMARQRKFEQEAATLVWEAPIADIPVG